MKKSLSVIIPNYNGKHLLESYLPSVFEALENTGVSYELIIIDDASKDDSIPFIKSLYPHITLLVNATNRGFSYTCNQGINIARNELTLLLNSDVRLTHDYFEKQWPYFQHEDTFGVMGRIMSADGSTIEDAARILFYNGCRIKANRFYYSTNNNDKDVYTAYLSGANALIDTKKLKALKGFDEIYSPFSSEDSDLSLRAWLLGWKCYYEHQSICYHQVSGSTKTQIKSAFIKTIYYRNRFIFHAIHLQGWRLKLWPAYALLVEVLPKIMAGKTWMFFSYKQYLQYHTAIERSRNNIKHLRSDHIIDIDVNKVMEMINRSISTKTIKYL
ncbi:GT2 family glycosyltransferase [Pedobacter sp. CAN_A7]|uniref:glycosyltransferase family 2 protein n=1 Tax=Pedobacter sp. CAN_A7 TaxID=2787722 RepID=UPI0018CAB2CF